MKPAIKKGPMDLSDMFTASLPALVAEYKRRKRAGDWFAHRVKTDFIYDHKDMGRNTPLGRKYRKMFGLMTKFDGPARGK